MPAAPALTTRIGRAAAARALPRVTRPDADRLLYNSFTGRFSDSPRAIYEELVRRGAPVRHAWLAAPAEDGFPADVVAVEPFAVSSLRETARAGHVVSNLQMPKSFVKRPGCTYVQTWHGTPLKKIGFDNERWQQNRSGLDRMARDFAQWDYLVSQNPFSTEIFRRAFRFDGEILETGYPRNDVLKAADAGATRRRVRAELGIPDGARVVLYAPTWRDNLVDDRGALRFALALDVERLAARLGDGHVLLLRLHYLLRNRLAGGLGSFGRDVSSHPDIRELYLAADVLITDYSSAMFDFAVTGRPIVFFTYDLAEYRDDVRGFYFDLEDEAPGPVCATTDEVADALADLDAVHAAHADRYARFQERFCPFDDGRAAARVVERSMPALAAGPRP